MAWKIFVVGVPWNIILRQVEFRCFSGLSNNGWITFDDSYLWVILTHIGKSRKLFPKNGRSLRGYLGNFFQTFSRFSNFGAWLRGFSGNYFQYLEQISVNSPESFPVSLPIRVNSYVSLRHFLLTVKFQKLTSHVSSWFSTTKGTDQGFPISSTSDEKEYFR